MPGNTLPPLGIAYAAYKAGFRGQGLTNIIAITMAESGGRIDAVNPTSGARGILQFMNLPDNIHRQGYNAQPKDYQQQFNAAYLLSNRGTNFCPWASYADASCPTSKDRNASYKNFLPVATLSSSQVTAMNGNFPQDVIDTFNPGSSTNWPSPGDIAGGLASDAAHGVIGEIPGVSGATDFFGNAWTFLTSKSGWARIGLFVIGLLLAYEAVKRFTHNDTSVTVMSRNLSKVSEGVAEDAG